MYDACNVPMKAATLTLSFKSSCDSTVEALTNASDELRNRLNHLITLITLSEKGAFYDDGKKQEIIPVHPRNISDVSGAGDTVIAVAALCLAAKLSIEETTYWANIAGGLVCEYAGVVPLTKNMLLKNS